jgi:hypothetical protein
MLNIFERISNKKNDKAKTLYNNMYEITAAQKQPLKPKLQIHTFTVVCKLNLL